MDSPQARGSLTVVFSITDVVQDEPDAPVLFHATQKRPRDYASSTISSLYDTPLEPDPFDFTVYMDQAPLTITIHSPLELVQELFVKLGARYVVVVNSDGHCEWLSFRMFVGPPLTGLGSQMKALLKRRDGWSSSVNWNTRHRLDLVRETFTTLTTRTCLLTFTSLLWIGSLLLIP